MKAFFENPEYLFGAIFLAIGMLGAGIPLLALALPERLNQAKTTTIVHHPDDAEYIRIGLILAAITLFEVALFYVEVERALLITVLIVMSAAKFVIVVSFFMHLKFDSRLFTIAFVTGLVLAGGVFSVVLATLGGNLI